MSKIYFSLVLFFFTQNLIAAPDTRIVGGLQAATNSWPATVAILNSANSDNFLAQSCGASLISSTWVLTAAHCVENVVNASDIEILVGTQSLASGGTRIPVSRIIIHDDYDSITVDSDIALIELAQATPVDIMPLYFGEPSAGDLTTVVGWGAMSYDQPTGSAFNFPTELFQVDVPVVSRSVCVSALGSSAFTANMVCAGFAAGGKDSCSGDSGGPIMSMQNGSFRQYGVVSWGDGCALPAKYGVYTRLSNFIDWINAETGLKVGESSSSGGGGGSISIWMLIGLLPLRLFQFSLISFGVK